MRQPKCPECGAVQYKLPGCCLVVIWQCPNKCVGKWPPPPDDDEVGVGQVFDVLDDDWGDRS